MSDDQTQVYVTESGEEVTGITNTSLALVDLKHFIGNAITTTAGILWIIRTIQIYPIAQREFTVPSVRCAPNTASLLKPEADTLVHYVVVLH